MLLQINFFSKTYIFLFLFVQVLLQGPPFKAAADGHTNREEDDGEDYTNWGAKKLYIIKPSYKNKIYFL